MRRKVDLMWNVFLYDFNGKRLVVYNALNDEYIISTMKKLIKKGEIVSKSDLKDFLARKFKARYMTRAEYEILVSDLFDTANAKRIDVWNQLEINLDNIVDYVNYKLELNLKDK